MGATYVIEALRGKEMLMIHDLSLPSALHNEVVWGVIRSGLLHRGFED